MADSDFFDPFLILGVELDATEAVIKRAYRRLAQQLHPDRNDAPDAEERFKELGAAYDELKSETKRSYWRDLMQRFADARAEYARRVEEERRQRAEAAHKAKKEQAEAERKAREAREQADRLARIARERIEQRGRMAREARARRVRKHERNRRRRLVRKQIELRRRERETHQASFIQERSRQQLLERYRALIDGNGLAGTALHLVEPTSGARSEQYHFTIRVSWKLGLKVRSQDLIAGDASAGTERFVTLEELLWRRDDLLWEMQNDTSARLPFIRSLDQDDDAAWSKAWDGYQLDFENGVVLSWVHHPLAGDEMTLATETTELIATATPEISFLWDECEDDSLAAAFRDAVQRNKIPPDVLREACRIQRLGRDEIEAGVSTVNIYYGATADLCDVSFKLDTPAAKTPHLFSACVLGSQGVDLAKPPFLDAVLSPAVSQMKSAARHIFGRKRKFRTLREVNERYPLLRPLIQEMTHDREYRPPSDYRALLANTSRGYLSDAAIIEITSLTSRLAGVRWQRNRPPPSIRPRDYF